MPTVLTPAMAGAQMMLRFQITTIQTICVHHGSLIMETSTTGAVCVEVGARRTL